MPTCDKCQMQIAEEDAHQHAGQLLCDDCYMDALSPARTCDPWAVYTASRLGGQELNPAQEAILRLIQEQGQATLEEMQQASGLGPRELEREIAALRHMELLRAEPAPGGGKVFKRFERTA